MSTQAVLCTSPVQAHQAVCDLFRNRIKRDTAMGRAGVLTWASSDRERRHQLRKAFHGPVLRDIAEQVWLYCPDAGCRVRYMPRAWKEYFRQLFLGPEVSTESLSDDEFADFVEQVRAHAAVELGVTFHDQEAGL